MIQSTTSSLSIWIVFPPTQRSDRLSSQITYNNGSSSTNEVFPNLTRRDELPNPFEEEEDDSNGQLQRRNLFQSLQNNSSYASLNASSKSATSSRAQLDPSKLNTTTRKPNNSISSINSVVPTTYSNHSESSQQNHLEKALPPNPKRKEFAKSMISAIIKPKKPKDTHHDATSTNDFGQLVVTPLDLPSVTSFSNMMNGDGVSHQVKETLESLSNSTSDSVDVVVYPKEPFPSTSASHNGYELTIQPPVIQMSQFHGDSVTHSGDNLDAQQKTSETNNISDSTPITQPLPVISKLIEREIAVVREIFNLEEFVSDKKPSTSPNVQSLPLNSTTSTPLQSPPLTSTTFTSSNIQSPSLNSTTTDSNPISPKDNNPVPSSTTTNSNPISPKNNGPVLNSTTTDSNHIFPKDNSATSTSSNIQSPSLKSTTTDSHPIPPKDSNLVRKAARRGPDLSSFLLNLAAPQVVSKEVPENVQPPRTQPWGPPLRSLQRISETGDSLPSDVFTPAPDDVLARKMEELGRLRRMESRNLLNQSTPSPETPTFRTSTSPKTELRPQLQTLQEDSSSEVATMLREAYKERQQSLQTQLDKALAELRDVKAENKRLKGENQSQQRSISQLKTELENKREQDKSVTQLNNQLRVANSSLAVLTQEKKGWQDKLDSMQHKVSAAERQVRCLDHLTRNKLESRQEAGYGQPKRRGQFATTPASTDVIGAMRAMNEEIYQTCVQFVDGLERTSVFSTNQKAEVQKMLGNHLTAMMEDQAKTATSDGYNMLLMQTVLEVFMTHWCSSIIEAFYPLQETFADLLVQLSAQTSNTSGK